jgi:hypothetical protein
MSSTHSRLRPGLAFSLLALIPLFAFRPSAARVSDAIVNYDGLDATKLPAKLSATGLYDNVASKSRKVTAGIVPYNVNVPLWSDGAHKNRWIQIPPGTKVVPTDTDFYDFPDKTVFIKSFAIDTVYGDSNSRIIIETRFLVVWKGSIPGDPNPDVHGISYKWRRDQSEADLVDQDAGLDTLHLVKLQNGKLVGKRWSYPSKSDCQRCHFNRGVLGFISPQLNDGKQLKALVTAGVLTADPFAGKTNSFRWYAGTDKAAAATLEAKARSYLGANCSHCHGGGNTYESCTHNMDYLKAGVDFNYNGATSAGGYVRKPPEQDYSGVYPFLVDPGMPESSFVMHRLTTKRTMEISGGLAIPTLNDDAMPPLATFQIDSANVTLVQSWICSLKPGKTCNMPPIAADTSFWDQTWRPGVGTAVRHGFAQGGSALKAYFHGRTLIIQGVGADGAVLFDFRGQVVPLIRSGAREYRLASTPRAGAYFLRIGSAMARISFLP